VNGSYFKQEPIIVPSKNSPCTIKQNNFKQMKKVIFYLTAITMLVFYSCSNTQDITVMRDIKGDFRTHELPFKQPPEYRIQPFDNLFLSIMTLDPEVNEIFNPSARGTNNNSGTQGNFGTPVGQYINGYMVDAQGAVNLPVIGRLELGGLTFNEAEELLKSRAEEYLKEPSVQVKFLNYKINIAGEVRNPNLLYNYENTINLFDAISLANGITDYADLTNIIVVRKTNGTSYTHRVDATSKNVYASEAFYLQPNDFVYIPPGNLKRTRDNTTVYSLILSAISTLVVVGTVVNNNFF
jgi:polysaccharide biosynthesis/export protein